ncbi:Flp pilus assembly protein CpaB [Psychromarinibacter sp. C21-152]|uniref:Flp pilus assembly protein CpaB n=1 Tax=Psychromarinibacter sediminicola TaxID=3033385 RepID=A0AAE3T6Y0_9RHOB|nr:Flp pilus assembly protein CpaB [Psychromarinibacter sediminicola]MDF0599795.1 Flp pilus assembly protein CpaB [Psychromarinibacter sediminicola]
MRVIFGLVLVIGLGLAGFAVYMAKGYLESERAARERIVPTVDVVVADTQLTYGQPIRKEDLRVIRWPENSVPKGAFPSIDAVFSKGEDVYRTALRTIEKNEPLMLVKITDPGEDAGVSTRLTKGMRAFAIKVDVASGVSGFLRPGDRVDVYWTGQLPDRRREGTRDVTKLILSRIKLVAVDQTADGERAAPTIARTVTVEVTPMEVAALAQAQSTGRLSLSLVGASDDTSVESSVEIDQNRLLGIEEEEKEEPEVVEAEEPEVCTIRTNRGGEIREIPIPCTN